VGRAFSSVIREFALGGYRRFRITCLPRRAFGVYRPTLAPAPRFLAQSGRLNGPVFTMITLVNLFEY